MKCAPIRKDFLKKPLLGTRKKALISGLSSQSGNVWCEMPVALLAASFNGRNKKASRALRARAQ